MRERQDRSLRENFEYNKMILTILCLLLGSLVGRVSLPASAQTFSCENVTQIPKSECEALVALYNSTDGKNWARNNGWLAMLTPCSWERVYCEDGHVTTLNLFSNWLKGNIPLEIGNLIQLKSLNLSYNNFSGVIPSEIGNLLELRTLKLNNNQNLSGNVPPEIGNLTKLNYLSLSENPLSGDIPPEIGNLKNLQTLNLHNNQFEHLPSEIGHLTELKMLSLSNNKLSSLPPEINNLISLEYLSLDRNQLTTLPSEWGHFPELVGLGLSHNQLTTLPSEWGHFPKLISLDLSYNQLTTLPSEWGHFPELVDLNISHNQLNNLPSEIERLIKLGTLRLSHNQLTTLPSEIYKLKNLSFLYLDNNQLSEALSPQVGDLTKLVKLHLENNQFTGELPPTLGRLVELEEFNLESNKFNGKLPPELGKLINLKKLILRINQFSGNIPSELGNLTNLQILKLSSNQFNGNFPNFLSNLTELRELSLGGNEFKSGAFPQEFGNLINLQILETGSLTGHLPPELGNLINLKTLNLSNNQLQGTIPPEIGNLVNLEDLYLYNNSFSGKLPPEIGNLTNLENLYLLKNNKLRGPLPESILNLTKLGQFQYHQTGLCAPPTPKFKSFLYRSRATRQYCSDLILSLNPGNNMEDIENFLNYHNVIYYHLFDTTRGNVTLKKDLGITRSYYIEASSVPNPEILRQKFLSLSDVEDCQHNQILEYDQQMLPSHNHNADDIHTLFPGNLHTFEEMEAWHVDRSETPTLLAVIDDFRSLNPRIKELVSPDNNFISHGVPVAQVLDQTTSDLMLFNVAPWFKDYGKFDEVFEAIEYAVDEKLDNPDYAGAVINLSLSAPITSLGKTPEERQRNVDLFQRWIKYAYLSGVPIVTSMGNFNWDVPHYPAAFPETIAVGGNTPDFQRWFEQATLFGSNMGEHLEFLELSSGGEQGKAGTSFSTARVTKTIASLLNVLLSKQPELSAQAVHEKLRWLLEITALDEVGDPAEDTPGRDPYYGWGIVDADAAAACAEQGRVLVRPSMLDFGVVKIGESASLPVMLTNCSSDQSFELDGGHLQGGLQSDVPDEFVIQDFLEGAVLESGKTSRFTLKFVPKTFGEKDDILAILAAPLNASSSSAADNLLEIPVHAKALRAEFSGLFAEPDIVRFGDVPTQTSTAKQVTLTNYLPDPVTIQEIAINDLSVNAGFQATQQYNEHILESGASIDFDISFAPETPGLKQAFLSITSADSPEPYEIPLYGNAFDPAQQTTSTQDPYLPYQPLEEPIPLDPGQLQAEADQLMQKGIKHYNNHEYWPAVETFQQAYKLYRLAQTPSGEAAALTGQGLAYSAVGRFENTLTLFLQARTIYQSLNDRLQEGILLNKIGMVYSRSGHYLDALHTFHEVLSIEQELQQRQDEGRTLMNIGVVYLNQGWLQQAKGYFEDALVVAQEVNDIECQGTILANLGTVYQRQEEFPEALKAYQPALRYIRQLSDAAVEEGTILLKIGDIHQLQSQTSEALQAFREAYTVFHNASYPQGEITVLRKIGELYREQSDFSEALTWYHKGVNLCQETGAVAAEIDVLEQILAIHEAEQQPLQQAATLSKIGERHNRLRQYDEAVAALMQAMFIQGALDTNAKIDSALATSAIHDQKGLSTTLMILGEVFLRKGETHKAMQLLQLALEAQGPENNWLDHERAHINLAEAYLDQGLYDSAKNALENLPDSGQKFMLLGEILAEQQAYDQALSALEQAVEKFASSEYAEEKGRALMMIGDLYLRTGQPMNAREYFQQALFNCRTAGDLQGEAKALTRLGNVREHTDAMQSYQQALELYRQLDDREGQLEVLHCMLERRSGQGEGEHIAALHLDLGKVYLSQGKYAEALSELEQAVSLFGNSTQAADALLQVGIAYRLSGDYAAALDSLETQALPLYGETPSSAKATLLLNIGETYFRQTLTAGVPNFDLALSYYHQALDIYDHVGDPQGKGATLMRIGAVYLKQENYQAAIQCYNEAVALLSQVDDHYNQVLALMSLGQAYNAEGLYWDALEAYRRALGIMHDTGNLVYADFFHTTKEVRRAMQIIDHSAPVNPGEVYQRLAETYEQLDHTDEALDALEQAAQWEKLEQEAQEAQETQEEQADLTDLEKLDDLEELEELEDLEEQLDEQREEHDYAAQEDTVKKIEELDPDYTLRQAQGAATSRSYRSEDEKRDNESEARTDSPQTQSSSNNPGIPTEQNMTRAPEQITPGSPPTSTSEPLASTHKTSSQQQPVSSVSSSSEKSLTTPKASEESLREKLRRRADTLNNMGLVYLRQDLFQKAAKAFLTAQLIQEKIGDDNGKAKTINNRGLLHYMLAQYPKAEQLFTDALELMRQVGDRSGEATILNHLALLYYRQGEEYESASQISRAESMYAQAINLFQQAQFITQEIEDWATQGTILNNQGLVYIRLIMLYRQWGIREADPQKALACFRKAMHLYQHASSVFQDALALVRKHGGRGGESATLHNLGKLFAVISLDDKALDFFQHALQLEYEIGNMTDAARTFSDIGYLYERQANELAQDDIPSFSTYIGALWHSLRHQAVSLLRRSALSFYFNSLSVQETLRTTARLEEFKISLAEEGVNVYQQAALLLMTMERSQDAFLLTERARARILLDQLGNVRLNIRDSQNSMLLEQEQHLRSDLTRLYQQVQTEQEKPLFVDNTELIDKLNAQIAEKQKQYTELFTQIKVYHPEYASLVSVNPPSLAEIQELLDEETSLLSYFVTPQTTLAFVIGRDSFEVIELAISEYELTQKVLQVRAALDAEETVDQDLQEFYDLLVAPVEASLQTPVVDIVPHDVLHYLPFAAVIADDDSDVPHYLGEKYILFALPSASMLPFLQQPREAESEQRALVMANKGYPPLKHAEEEAIVIAELYDTTPVLGEDATGQTFVESAAKAEIIHLSSHAKLNSQSPLSSGFLLHDGYLTIHDLYGLNLKQTDLAVLSACSTQLGQQSRGDDIVALNRAFMYAGVPSVVASLWNVDDAATSELMIAFHQHLTHGLSKAEALRQAQIDARANYPHPRYWAAFVLTGAPGKSERNK